MLRIITTILGVLMASLFLIFDVGNLINPDVLDSALDQNTRVCVTVIFTGVVSIYTLFRPYSGGIVLCTCAWHSLSFPMSYLIPYQSLSCC
jgi:hypothetical protein